MVWLNKKKRQIYGTINVLDIQHSTFKYVHDIHG